MKAAERAGVHPFFLDDISSYFALQIEEIQSMERVKFVMNLMITRYCRLVNKNVSNLYSYPIQKAIVMIESNLSEDLSLQTLSNFLSLSPSYLSALFKKEVGITLTDYVTQRRMNKAEYLLKNTSLQVQTISTHCGFTDANYFSKIFKKLAGLSPYDFRRGR